MANRGEIVGQKLSRLTDIAVVAAFLGATSPKCSPALLETFPFAISPRWERITYYSLNTRLRLEGVCRPEAASQLRRAL